MTQDSRTPKAFPPRSSTLTRRPRAHLEVVDVRTGTPRLTGLGGIFKTDELTHDEFEYAREQLTVPLEEADFLVDYYGPTGNLIDTVPISSEGFKRIFKDDPRPPEYYELHDQVFRASKHPNVYKAHDEATAVADAAFNNTAQA